MRTVSFPLEHYTTAFFSLILFQVHEISNEFYRLQPEFMFKHN